jgi:hypothetical protein
MAGKTPEFDDGPLAPEADTAVSDAIDRLAGELRAEGVAATQGAVAVPPAQGRFRRRVGPNTEERLQRFVGVWSPETLNGAEDTAPERTRTFSTEQDARRVLGPDPSSSEDDEDEPPLLLTLATVVILALGLAALFLAASDLRDLVGLGG